MTTRVTLIIDNPDDVDAFDSAWPKLLTAAGELPLLERLESGKVWPKEDGSPTPAHSSIDLYFQSYDDASAAVASPPAGIFFTQLATLSTFTGLFIDLD